MKVLLVELNDSHDDSLIAWRESLRTLGHSQVSIACSQKVIERCGQHAGDTWIEVSRSGGLWSTLMTILRIRRHIKRSRSTHMVMTTASGTRQWMLLACVPRRITKIGILHYMHLIGTSTTQKRIERVLDAYVVISPHLLEMPHQEPSIPIHVVPQNVRLIPSDTAVPHKSSNEVWIVVPGTVELRRRAYGDLLTDEVIGLLPSNVRVIILGNAGQRADPAKAPFYEMVDRYPSQVTVFDRYVDHQSFHDWMSKADMVLPLLHPGTAEYEDFLTDKCSGAFTMAWAYGLPLLLESGFSGFHHLRHGSLFYDVGDLGSVLLEAVTRSDRFGDIVSQARHPLIGNQMRLTATQRVLESPNDPTLS